MALTKQPLESSVLVASDTLTKPDLMASPAPCRAEQHMDNNCQVAREGLVGVVVGGFTVPTICGSPPPPLKIDAYAQTFKKKRKKKRGPSN